MAIPVENIYYLLCYAWDHPERASARVVGGLDGGAPVEHLLGRVLADATDHLLRQGLDRGYLEREEEERRVRGRLLMEPTVRRMLMRQGRAACLVDELSHDVPHNQALKAGLRALSRVTGMERALAHRLRTLCLRLGDVSEVPLHVALRSVQLHRNISRYSFAMHVVQLVADNLLPDERGQGYVFRSITQSDQQLGLLFEKFVRNFLKREQSYFAVERKNVTWAVAESESSGAHWLPGMETDVVLTSGEASVVIEAKCTASALMRRYDGADKLRSAHLYQLMTYLTQHRAGTGISRTGVLLYAGHGAGQPLTFTIDGFRVLVRNLDLSQPWQMIRDGLLALAEELSVLSGRLSEPSPAAYQAGGGSSATYAASS